MIFIKETKEAYVLISHDIEDIYYAVVSKEEFTKYKNIKDEDEQLDFITDLDSFTSAAELFRYIRENNLVIMDADEVNQMIY